MPKQPIDVTPDEWEIVRDILERVVPERDVWAFGSRVTGTEKPFSDLDLVVIGDEPLPTRLSARLTIAFDDSDLPFKVDVVDWATTRAYFQKIIERDKVVIHRGSGQGKEARVRPA